MGRRYCREPVSLLSLAAAIAVQASQAAAQDLQQSDPPVSMGPPDISQPSQDVTETIVVTGSRIPRPNLTAVSPVTVVSQDEFDFQGTTMAEELLNRLPQVAPSQGAFISNGATGTATVDLRNLGAARSLVLVNGRRLGPGDPGTPVADINMIPSSLVQRVEVLTGGASSVYGSDAVAGVVNFILDTRLDGLRIDAQASFFQHNNRNDSGLGAALDRRGFNYPKGNTVDGGRQDINFAYGTSFLDDRAHVTLYGGYRKLEELRQDARDYSACAAEVARFNNELLICGGSPTSYPGTFFTNFSTFTIGFDRTFVEDFIPFNYGPWNFYQRPGRRWTGGGFADFEVSNAFKPYLELMYMDDRSVAQIAPSGNFQNTEAVNCDNPLLSEQQFELVCFDSNYFGQRALFDDDGNLVEIQGSPIPFVDPVTGATYLKGNLAVLRRAVESGGRQEDLRHKNLRILAGFKGDIGRGVSYDASYIFGRAKMTNAHLNDFSITRIQRSLDVVTDPGSGQPVCRSVLTGEDPECVPWDIFALGGVSAEAMGYLNRPSFIHGAVKEQVANANATVELGEWGVQSPWADAAPSINIGVEYRKDRLDYVPDELAQTGDLAGQGFNNPPVHGSTQVTELFAEARIPLLNSRLIEDLTIEGGYRKSWYDAGDASFTTSAYKLALDLTVVRGLRLRASHQRAVRAPNINELFLPPISDAFFIDPCAGTTPDSTLEQCALTGVTAEQYGHIIPIPDVGFFAYNAIAAGNGELQPEIAKTNTVGLVLEPGFLTGFTATIDWWDIRLTDAIAYVGGDTIIANCVGDGDPLFCERIHRDPNGSLWLSTEGFIDTRLFNIGSYKVSGIDVGFNYRRVLGSIGTGNLSFLGSYLEKYETDNGGLSEAFDCAGRYGVECFSPTPRWRHNARLTWEGRQGITVSFNWRYTGEMKIKTFAFLDPGPLSKKLDPQSFFDLSALFQIKDRYLLSLGVNNIFDREPPLVPFGEGGCIGSACNGNTYVQWYDPLGRYFFAGITVDF